MASLVGATVLVIAGAILYSQRGVVGARIAVGYLKDRGVPAVIVVERLDPGGFTGRVVLGDPKDPDLSVERVEVEFEPVPLLKGGILAPRIRTLRLVEPRLKARWDGKRLTFGSLQHLIDDFSGARGAGPSPTVVIERGAARLATPAGELRLTGDGRLDQGRLTRLAARLQPARLRRGDLTAEVAGATLTATTKGKAIAAVLHLDVPRLAQGGARAEALLADATAEIPYGGTMRFDGPFALDATVRAAALSSAGQTLAAPKLTLALAGSTAGPLDHLAIKGSGTGSLTASAYDAPAASARAVALAGRFVGLDLARTADAVRFSVDADLGGGAAGLKAAGLSAGPAQLRTQLPGVRGVIDKTGGNLAFAPDITVVAPRLTAAGLTLRDGVADVESAAAVLDWRKAGWKLSGPLQVRARAGALTAPILAGDLTLHTVALALSGPAALGSGAPSLDLTGSLRSQGGALSPAGARAFAAALPLIGTDPVGEKAILAAFRTARLEAPAFALRTGSDGLRLSLARPVQLTGAGGARATLSARSGAPVAVSAAGGTRGGLTAQLSGAGLPVLGIDIPAYSAGLDRWGLTLQAQARLTAAFDGATLHDLKLEAPTRLTRIGGVLTAELQDCAPVSLGAFGQGAMPLLTAVTTMACADTSQPALSLGPRRWRFRTRLRGFTADAPAGEAQIRDGRGLIELSGAGGSPMGFAEIASARVLDGAKVKRFQPLALKGRLDLARDVWTGPIQVAEAARGRPLATVQVVHAMATAVGGADISAPALAFAPGALQPGDLSPVAGNLAADAQGTVSFTGRADWSPAGGVTTRGRLTTTGFDFRSQFGQVKGAAADLTFTSLAPLATAPGQAVSAEAIGWLLPLTAAAGRIELKPDRIAIEAASAELSGGRIVVDPMDLPFAPASALSGAVRLTQIDLGALIEHFNLADKLAIEARIDGVVPFALSGGSVRLDHGRIFATGPGRLSLKREALTGATASAPGAPPAASAGMQDIAYQALENLAFDKLEAEIASQPKGRLGILFRINGRNDPPDGGETRISLFDLLRGKAFDGPIALPKGTPVNLTLDTSLNFEELLAAYNERGRSEPVQAGRATTDPAKK